MKCLGLVEAVQVLGFMGIVSEVWLRLLLYTCSTEKSCTIVVLLSLCISAIVHMRITDPCRLMRGSYCGTVRPFAKHSCCCDEIYLELQWRKIKPA